MDIVSVCAFIETGFRIVIEVAMESVETLLASVRS